MWGASDIAEAGCPVDIGFKSCPRVGGIPLSARRPAVSASFQVVPPCGGHLFAVCSGPLRIAVSSRAPVWGASWKVVGDMPMLLVSSRAPVWGASPLPSPYSNRALFQVVPPCGGHLRTDRTGWETLFVSSRAPVWGASALTCQFLIVASVSSRAPVWGASQFYHKFSMPHVVSSRAPVWGASPVTPFKVTDEGFQVVPPCGGHPVWVSSVGCCLAFQVVPPCGGHPLLGNPCVACKRVSSRAPVWGASCYLYSGFRSG